MDGVSINSASWVRVRLRGLSTSTEMSSFSLSLFSEGEVCVAGVGWTELTSASVSARTVASLFRGILAGR